MGKAFFRDGGKEVEGRGEGEYVGGGRGGIFHQKKEVGMSEQDVGSVSAKWRAVALLAIVALGMALVAVVFTAVRRPDTARVTQQYGEGAALVNTGAIIDATDPAVRVTPQVGYRYRVFVDDESDDRASGIARIGGRTTFIDGARRGQTCVVDVTRVQERVVNASLVHVVAEVTLPPKPRREPFVPAADDPSAFVVDGAVLDVVISEASSKNPETEGVAKVAGLVVFVDGETELGKRVNVRIRERRERMAFAELTGDPAGTDPLPYAAEAPRKSRSFVPRAGDETAFVVPGAEFDVVITEASSKKPDTEGVARVRGLVIFVDGAATIGERVNIRVTDRRERMAFAVPSGKAAGKEPLTYAQPAPRPRRSAAYVPAAGEDTAFVVPGAEFDVIITEPSSKNPLTEGVARVRGLVVFVEGATKVGDRVNVRITDRRERMAFAALSGKPAGTGPLPYVVVEEDKPEVRPVAASVTTPAVAPAKAPVTEPVPAAKPALVDETAHVIPGAILDVTIEEPSRKNPTEEGVAREKGLVIFVKGATKVGEQVKIRITDRKARVAFAETISPVEPAVAEPESEPAAEPSADAAE